MALAQVAGCTNAFKNDIGIEVPQILSSPLDTGISLDSFIMVRT